MFAASKLRLTSRSLAALVRNTSLVGVSFEGPLSIHERPGWVEGGPSPNVSNGWKAVIPLVAGLHPNIGKREKGDFILIADPRLFNIHFGWVYLERALSEQMHRLVRS
jgi:hypothetical protein